MSVKDVSHSKQKRAYNLSVSIRDMLTEDRRRIITLGKMFKELKHDKLYQHVGEGGYNSFKDFLKNEEYQVNEGLINKYINIVNLYIDKLGLDDEYVAQIPFWKLDKLASSVRNLKPDQAIEILEGSVGLTTGDFKDYVKEIKGEPIEHKHYEICEACGTKVLVKDDNER